MMWCTICNDAVEEELRSEHIQGDEYKLAAYCPTCGKKLYLEADICPVCGENKPAIWASCFTCRAIIGVGLQDIIRELTPSMKEKEAAWDAVAEVFSEKYDEAMEEWRARK